MRDRNSRDVSVDIIRILAAFLVVFSHATDRFVIYPALRHSLAWNIIYYLNTLSRIAVPLFIMLSGYLLLRKEKIKNTVDFYKRRLSRILSPFIFWAIIYAGFDISWDKTRLTLNYVLQRLWDGGGLWHLYFLVVILELYLIAPILMSVTGMMSKKNKTILFLLLIIFSIFCSLLKIYNIDFKQYSFTIFIPYIGIFYAGAYLRDINVKKILVPILLAIYFLFGFITNKAGGGILGTFIVLNYSPTILPMTICLFLTLKDIIRFSGNRLLFSKIIVFMSSATFGIFLIHPIILDNVFYFLHLYPWQIHAPLVFYASLPAILTFLISFFIISIIRNIPFGKYLVG
jgi:surface polysaccharide O-acyltransferase-like enzyme